MTDNASGAPSPKPYANGVERRHAILAAASDLFASRGYRAVSVREIAVASGTTHSTVLHHFSSKEELLRAVIARRDEEVASRAGVLDPHRIPETLIGATRDNVIVPGLIASFVSAAAEATAPDHPAHEHFRERYAGTRRTATRLLERAQSEGELVAGLQAEDAASLLLALQDGLQIQWLLDPENVDIVALMEQFMRLMFAHTPTARADDARARNTTEE